MILGRSSPPTIFKALGHLKSFLFIMNFRINLSIFTKIKIGILTRIALNLWINLGTTGIFIVLTFPTKMVNFLICLGL